MAKADTAVVVGLDMTLYNMRVLSHTYHQAAERGISKAADFYESKLAFNTTKTDHSLRDLARMDHPYARRHPKFRRVPGHSKWWQVHKQSGEMSRAMYKQRHLQEFSLPMGITAFKGFFEVGFKPEKAPQVNWVIYGTDKMHGRPVVALTFNQFHNRIKKYIITEMGRAHTHAIGRFKKVTV